MRHRIFSAALALALALAAPVSPGAQQPPAKKNAPPPSEQPPQPSGQQPGQDAGDDGERLLLGTTQVVVNVTVTDPLENYVRGLKPADFQILEDGRSQPVVSFSHQETPFSAVLLLDTSGSMTHKMSLARAACSQFTANLLEGDVVAIYSFGGTKVTTLQEFSEVRDVDPLLWETKADGETPLYDAIVKAADALAGREEKRRAVIVISDGADTKSKATLDQALRRVHAANAAVYAVDMSEAAFGRGGARDTGAEVLKEMAAKSGGRFYATPGGQKLRDAFAQTIDELRNQYTLAYEPTNEKQDGRWRAIEVRLSRATLKARARQGYYAPKSGKP
jgi:Ca-activated chloride channel homolog